MSHEQLPDFVPEGNLEEHPLPLLIALILNEKLSGTLHIESGETRYWIYFEDGFPAGVHDPKSQAFLGAVLRELSYIDDAAFNESLMIMAKTKKLQGQVLLEMGTIDEEKLDRGLSLQLARKLSRLFAVRTGDFQFVEDEDLPPPGEPIRVNSYALIYNAIRNSYGPQDLKNGLSCLVGKSVRVSRLFVERGALFEFPPEDLADAKLLEVFRLPQEFVRAASAGSTASMMMLLALLYCDMLEFEEADFAQPILTVRAQPAQPEKITKTAKAAEASKRAPADSRVRKVPDSLQRKIDDKFEQIKRAAPWEVLEVEKDAGGDRLKKAFLTLAKVYHPDRVAGTENEEIRHRMDVIIAKVNEAYQLLSDPNARMKYISKADEKDKAPKTGKTEPRPEEAKMQFQKAMVYFKKHDHARAAESLRWATDLHPDMGDYLAWRHWLDYLRSDEPEEVKLDTAKGDLLALSKSQPECFCAARFLTKIYQKLNDAPNYEKFLVRANSVDPKNVEVARELRLHASRKEKADKNGKFLGVRFRKPKP